MANSNTMKCAVMALLSALLALGVEASSAGGLYKWTDERGVVHYSDQIPPEAVDKGTVMLDKQGRQVKRIEPAPTPAQLKAKEAEAEREKALTKAKDERARRDLALLQSYSSVDEIDFARNRALSSIEVQLKSAETYNADLKKRLADLEKQKTALAGTPVPAALENQVSAINDEMGRQAQLIAQKKDEMAAVSARYDADKRHWQEIKADQARAAAAANASPSAAAPPKPNAARAPSGNSATATR
jgi:chromosome segregation ATPase